MGLEVSVTCVSVGEMGRRQVDKKNVLEIGETGK